MELVAGAEGFEPSLTVLETVALPLNYAPIMEHHSGVEPDYTALQAAA